MINAAPATRRATTTAWIFCFATAVLGGSAVSLARPQETQPASTARPQPRTVRANVQLRPGGERSEVDMSIHPSPTDLPIVAADQATLPDDDLVLGAVIDDQPVAFPIRYLGMFEVVNVQVGTTPVAPTWCPLTGTGSLYDRRVGDKVLTFDFAEGLLNNNLLVCDRETSSVWSQLSRRAIAGPLDEHSITLLPTLQTTWKFWRDRHPKTQVMVVPNRRGRAYRYFNIDFDKGRPTSLPSGNDTSVLGLGVHLGEAAAFFPFRMLDKTTGPVQMQLGEQTMTVHYRAEAMTAWAEDSAGNLLPGVLVYEHRWLKFDPQSIVFQAE